MKPSRWKANEPDATAVIRRFLDGDDDSLAALWNRVKAGSTMQAKRLLRHAGVSASQFDEDDAANSVLFRIHQARRRGKLDWVKSNEDFRRLFSVVLRRVVLDARRRLNASRRRWNWPGDAGRKNRKECATCRTAKPPEQAGCKRLKPRPERDVSFLNF